MVRPRTCDMSVGAVIATAILLIGSVLCKAQAAPPATKRDGIWPVRFEVMQSVVPRYDVLQILVHIDHPLPGNPFRDRLVAGVFTHVESGEALSVEGYCDSQDGSRFGLRFCPQREGKYTFDAAPERVWFEPVTGDYLFLSWGTGNDQMYIVQGFKPPPPLF